MIADRCESARGMMETEMGGLADRLALPVARRCGRFAPALPGITVETPVRLLSLRLSYSRAAGVIRRNAGSSSSLIRRMLASAWPTGMPLQWVRKIRKLAPASSQHGRNCS